MSFAAPWLLLALLALPAAAWALLFLELRRRRRAAAWGTVGLLPNLVEVPTTLRRHAPAVLLLVGLTFLLLGVARPQARLSSVRPGSTIVLLQDVSGSMAATDVKPTRLLAARNAALVFLQHVPSQYRVALITFGDHPAVVESPTYAHDQIAPAFPIKARVQGTDIGDAIEAALKVAVTSVGKSRPGAPHPPAEIVLLSDGAQTIGGTAPGVAAKAARKAGVPVSSVLVGTAKGVVVQKLKVGGYPEAKTISVPADPTDLLTIARVSGGRFFRATTASELDVVYKDLGAHAVHERTDKEVTAAAVGLALVFIVAAVGLSVFWFREIV